MALGFGMMVVATSSQCYIYSASNWNTPHIFDLRQGAAISLILLSQRHFMLLDTTSGPIIYSYEGGRMVSSPKFPGLRPDCLSRSSLSLAPDCLAIVDHTDGKCK